MTQLWKDLRGKLFSRKGRRPGFFVRLWYTFRRLQPLYWLRTHTIDRYHMVDCARQHKLTGYKWGWNDVDSLMLYAMFELFMRFVENEDGLDNLKFQASVFPGETEPNPVRVHVYEEAVKLHAWWTVLRPLHQEELRTNTPCRDWYRRGEQLDETDTEMMIRLAKIRRYLWT